MPLQRVVIPAHTTETSLSLKYTRNTIPVECQLQFALSSTSTSSVFALTQKSAWLSASLSIDKSSTVPYMLLELTHEHKLSNDIGDTVATLSDIGSGVMTQPPTVYELTPATMGANQVVFTATTSTQGRVRFVVVDKGYPTSTITPVAIYRGTVSRAISYGSSKAILPVDGVNTDTALTLTKLESQHDYILVAYINSTIGVSAIKTQEFTTSKANNGATVKIALAGRVAQALLATTLSRTWRIKASRIYLVSVEEVKDSLESTYEATIMNNRQFVY